MPVTHKLASELFCTRYSRSAWDALPEYIYLIWLGLGSAAAWRHSTFIK